MSDEQQHNALHIFCSVCIIVLSTIVIMQAITPSWCERLKARAEQGATPK